MKANTANLALPAQWTNNTAIKMLELAFQFPLLDFLFWFIGVGFLIAPNQLSELLNPQPPRSPHWRLAP